MKKSTFGLIGLCLLFTIIFTAPMPSASAGELPKLITFTAYKVGSFGYTALSGFREAIEQKTPMKVRVEPYDTDVARILPLKLEESEITLLTGATGTCASYGMADFSTKKWGPQPIRIVWRGMTLYVSAVVRGDTGISDISKLKGKRFPYVPGWPAGNLNMEGYMAFGNLTWDDVVKVPMSGYVDCLRGVIEGKLDIAIAATITSTVKELESGPHKAGWIVLPHKDKAGWERVWKIAPWIRPGVCKRAPGLPKGQTMEIGQYPYALWAYDHADDDMIYEVVKAMHKGFDIYKGMHRAMPLWNINQAVTDPSPVPYHEGAVRYYKEAGVWTPAMDKRQAEQIKTFNERLAKFKKK